MSQIVMPEAMSSRLYRLCTQILGHEQRPLTVVTESNNLVRIIPIIMMPIESQVVARFDLDGVWGLYITHDIASHVKRVYILDG